MKHELDDNEDEGGVHFEGQREMHLAEDLLLSNELMKIK